MRGNVFTYILSTLPPKIGDPIFVIRFYNGKVLEKREDWVVGLYEHFKTFKSEYKEQELSYKIW